MSIKISLNDKGASSIKTFLSEIEGDFRKGIEVLAKRAFTQGQILAGQKLKSTQKTFLENYSIDEVGPSVWIISLGEDAMWIEDGIEPNTDMKPALLKGKKYRVVPFKHDKPPSQVSGHDQNLRTLLKSKLKKAGIPWAKIEKNSDGSPRLGKLHTLNLGGHLPSNKASSKTLEGVNIYQRMDKTSGKVKRDIITFRTVSSGPASAGKWIHPGLKGAKILDEVHQWIVDQFDNSVVPEILEKHRK